jgi:hypothetical protein
MPSKGKETSSSRILSFGEQKLLVALHSGKPRVRTRVKVVYKTCKYFENHYLEVDDLYIKGGLTQKAALEKIAKKYKFNVEGFSKQYRVVHLRTIRKPKKKEL